MTSRVQTQRFAATATRPPNGSRPPGEFWLNFPDLRLGMIDPSKAAIDILPVRFYASTATYAAGDYTVYQGQLQRAVAALAPKTYAASDWDLVVGNSAISANYLALTGGAMRGQLTLAADPTIPLAAATKQYADTKLPLAGGTLTGALVLAANPTTNLGAATKQYVDAQLTAQIPIASSTLPLMDGTAAVGTGTTWARSDHVHPSDTSRVNKAGDAMTGNLVLPALYATLLISPSSYNGNEWYFNCDAASGDKYQIFRVGGWFDRWRSSGGNREWYGNNQPSMTLTPGGVLTLLDRAVIGGNGINYSALGGHSFALGWNGQVNLYVDGGYQGDLATTVLLNNTVGNYLRLSGGEITGNLGVDGALWSNGAFTAYAGLTVYGNAALTANAQVGGSLDVSSYLTVHNHGTVGDSGWYYSSAFNNHGFSFWFGDTGNLFCRVDNSIDIFLTAASDENLKQDIAPSTFDCLDMIQRVELYEFRYQTAPDAPLVPVGFSAQRQQELFPTSVDGELTLGINPIVMVAALCGAVQQLANEIDAIKAGAYS